MHKTRTFDLGRGGWVGWTFGPYGRAKEWRLFAPDGTGYSLGELRELRALAVDVDFLRMRVRELEAKTAGASVSLSPEEIHTLRAASQIIEKKLPRISMPPALRLFRASGR